MNILNELPKNWIERLETSDEVMAEIVIDDISYLAAELKEKQQKVLVSHILDNIKLRKSEKIIKNGMKLLKSLQDTVEIDIFVDYDLTELNQNPEMISKLLETFIQQDSLCRVIDNFLESDDSEMQNFIIGLIGQHQKMRYRDRLFELLIKYIDSLKSITELFNFELKISARKRMADLRTINGFLNLDTVKIIDSDLAEVKKYNIMVRKYLNRENIEEFVPITKDLPVPSLIKRDMIIGLLEKTIILLGTLLQLGSIDIRPLIEGFVMRLLPFKSSGKLQILKKPYFLSLEKILSMEIDVMDRSVEFLFDKLKILCYLCLGRTGNIDTFPLLSDRFHIEMNEECKVSILHAIGSLNGIKNERVEFLINQSKDEKYYFHSLAGLLKIGGSDVEDFIYSQLKDGSPRKVLLSSFFVPYMEDSRFDQVGLDLLQYKEPLLIRQGLWIVKKRKTEGAVPYIVDLILSEDTKISEEAIKTLDAFREMGIRHIKRKINYYGEDKQIILREILADLESKVQMRLF